MKTFLNSFKTLNISGLLAILLITAATLAFTPKKIDRSRMELYGKNSNGDWVPLNGATQGSGPGEYTCEFGEDVCTAFFEDQPEPTDEPRLEDIIDPEGVYTLH